MLCQSPFTHFDPLQDRKKLYQFLDFCQQQSIADCHAKIVSISLKIDAIDPLAILRQRVKSDQIHFYFENRDQEKAIAAIGVTRSIHVEGSQRFSKAKTFIQDCLDHLISNSPFNLAWTTPRFFCSFTFFAQENGVSSPFPPATIFLPRWQIIRWQSHHAAIVNLTIDSDTNLEHLTDLIWQEFQAIHLTQAEFFPFPTSITNVLNWEIIDTHDFQSTVLSALQSIQTQQFNKLVLAHAIDVIAPLPFQWEQSLHNLRQLYPDCYVFSISNGKGQSFIGASPERLLSLYNRRLVTDALAGSAPRGQTIQEDAEFAQRLLSSDKERREHQVVVDFIAQKLTQFGLNLRLTNVPDLLQLSNIQHLHTPIHTAIPTTIHPLDILAELHPTPAVAGMPRDLACQHIQSYEGFERSLYAAPLGWVDAKENAEFVVGIRSALLNGHHARLYAGAGIVAGSNPEREMAEVRLKLQALLRALV